MGWWPLGALSPGSGLGRASQTTTERRWQVRAPKIENYRFGQMVVDGISHTRDLILLPDRVVANWWREAGHRLAVADMQVVIDAAPEIAVIGTGAYGRMRVPQETHRALKAAGIDLRVSRTVDAWGVYNDLREPKNTQSCSHGHTSEV